jgi:hypothetical protein
MSSVRERMEQVSSGPDRAVTTDHSASAWGTLSVVNKIENTRGVSYLTACSCGAQGQRVSQQELASGIVPVCRFCNGTGVAPGDARRVAGVAEERLREDATGSVGARYDAARRAAEIKQLEEESSATNS